MHTRYVRLLTALVGLVVLSGLFAWVSKEAEAQSFPIYLPMTIGGNGNQQVTIPETTEVIAGQTLAQLESVSANGEQFVFDGSPAALDELDVGDVMVGAPTAAAPDGFLRKVTGLQDTGNKRIVTTTPATLDEAITDGSLDLSLTLSPDKVASTILMPGVSMAPSDRSGMAADTFSYTLDEFVIYERDGNDATKNDQFTADGTVAVSQDIDFGFDIRGGSLEKMDFIITSDTNSELRYKASVGLGATLAEKKKVLARHTFQPITVMVGFVPIVFTPELAIVLGVDGSVEAETTFGVQYSTHMEFGLRLENGNWGMVGDASDDFSPLPVTVDKQFKIQAGVGPQLAIKLYGVVGPYAEAKIFGALALDSLLPFKWKLYAGLTVPVGVKLEIFSKLFVDISRTVIEIKILIAEGGDTSNDPPFIPANPDPPHLATGRPLGLRLAWTGGDPDGDPTSYDVFMEFGDSSPDVMVCNTAHVAYCDVTGLDPNETYYWRVVAEDNQGASTSGPVWRFDTAGGVNQPPFIPSSPIPPNNSDQQEIYLQLKWVGGDPDGDPTTYTAFLEAGDNTPDAAACSAISVLACDVGPLSENTTYYWRVEATDSAQNKTTGPVWKFTTRQGGEPIKTIDVAVIIDSSGSMAWNDPANMRKTAAKVFIGAMVSGDMLTIVDFDGGVRVPFHLQTLTNDRSAPLAAVDTIDSSGTTNIGLGLQTGYDQLVSSPNTNPKAAVLLTDGDGEYFNQAQLYHDKGWPVFTIGLSGDANEALLRQIASETGGQYFSLTNPNQLSQVYFAIQAAVTGSDVVVETAFVMEQGQSATIPAAIDTGQNTANFVVNWPGSRVDATLVDPNGRVITPDTAQNDATIYHAKGATYEIYRIANPPAGQWQIELYGAELDPGGEEVTVQVSQRDNELVSGAWGELGSGSASGGGISQTADDSSRPAITHVGDDIYAAWVEDRAKQSDIYVRRWDGNAWVEVGAGSASGGGVSNTATISDSPWLEAAPDGSIYLAWAEKTAGGYEVYVRRWDGSTWGEVGAGSASGGGISQTATESEWPSMGISTSGVVYVAWEESQAADKEIYVRHWNGNAWAEVGVGSASGGGISNNAGDSGRPFLAVDQNGNPIVGWSDDSPGDTEVYARRWSGGTWGEVGGSASGGGISNNAGDSRPPVIGVDSTGIIYVTWPDNTGGHFDIYVKSWDGNAWVEVGAGSAASGGISGSSEVSLAPHVAVAPDDTVYVIWYERLGTNTDILIRRWNGSFWVEVGAGSATGGGISNTLGSSSLPSVTITGANMPVVAWNDNTSGNYEIYVKAWR